MPPATQSSPTRQTAPTESAKAGLVRPEIGIAALLVLAILTVYAQVTKFDFVNVDDLEYVRDNFAVNGGLSWERFKWAFHHNVVGNWHPVTMLTHMLDCTIYGLVP